MLLFSTKNSRRFASSSTGGPTKEETAQAGGLFSRDWKIPAVLGFSLIGFLQWHHLNNPTEEERKAHPAPALRRLPGEKTAFEETMATERQLQSLKLFPYRAASRLWGEVHDKELYVSLLRVGIDQQYRPLIPTHSIAVGSTVQAEVASRTRVQGVDGGLRLQTGRNEVGFAIRARLYGSKPFRSLTLIAVSRYPLETYANLGEFFSRPLKDGARVFDSNPRHIASPVDGTVASIGVVDSSSAVPTLEQVKGARYRLDEFLGSVPSFFTSAHDEQKRGKKMYHCVLYLAPGDYHRIHAPVDWSVSERRHFPGNLFPVNKIAARLIPSLFIENERVALLGEWEHGFFSLIAVGATNVGSIVLSREPEFRSNTKDQDSLVGKCIAKVYAGSPEAARGEEMAQFKVRRYIAHRLACDVSADMSSCLQLGSTVVLVFEAPESFEFTIKPGDKVTDRCAHWFSGRFCCDESNANDYVLVICWSAHAQLILGRSIGSIA